MTSFASYAFNKSHAAAYATISYQTAYLKCHHYKEYMAALMTNALLDSTDKLFGYIASASKSGVNILPIDINKSERGFVAQKEGIRFALLAVKSLGENAIASIVAERNKGGDFKSLWDFCKRVSGRDISTRTVEALIKSGAFDCFANNRHEMLDACAEVMSAAAQSREQTLEGQLDFFGLGGAEEQNFEKPIPQREEFPSDQLLAFEHEALGMYLSGHPTDDLLPFAKADRCVSISQLAAEHERTEGADEGKSAKIVAMVSSRRALKTKKGDMMCFVQVEDKSSDMEIIVFPELYRASSAVIKDGAVVFVSGKISGREDEKPKIIADSIITANEFAARCEKRDVCIRARQSDTQLLDEIKVFAAQHSAGSGSRLIIYFEDTKRKTSLRETPFISLDKQVLTELMQLAGEDNVAFMEKKL